MIFVVLVVSSYLSGDSAIINRRTPFKRASATFVILIFVVPFASTLHHPLCAVIRVMSVALIISTVLFPRIPDEHVMYS